MKKWLSKRLVRIHSLKTILLCLVLPVMLMAMLVSIWSSSKVIAQQAEKAYDRSLAAVVHAIDQNISTDTGGLAIKQPYQLLDFFRLTASGDVYYRVGIEGGLAEIGYANLPQPPDLHNLPSNQIHFFEGDFLDGEPIRSAFLLREMDPPLDHTGRSSNRVYIQVAESMLQRNHYTRSMIDNVIMRDVVLSIFVVLILITAIHLAMRPLRRLSRSMAERMPDDLRPISTQGLPKEVLPLVQAINTHMQRYAEQSQQRRQFLDDASHQLRTPLAMLRTKMDYALREHDPAEMRVALSAMRSGLDRAERVTNQMLLLARAHDNQRSTQAPAPEHFNLNAVVEDSVRLLWPAARAKRLRYELELPNSTVHLQGSSLLLQEALVNLIDNAIKYSPEGASLVVGLTRDDNTATVFVQDSGKGMSAQDIAQAGVRFRRGQAGQGTSGAGLGLAIVATIAKAHSATLSLSSPAPSALRIDDESHEGGLAGHAEPQNGAKNAEMAEKNQGLRVELVFILSSIARI